MLIKKPQAADMCKQVEITQTVPHTFAGDKAGVYLKQIPVQNNPTFKL